MWSFPWLSSCLKQKIYSWVKKKCLQVLIQVSERLDCRLILHFKMHVSSSARGHNDTRNGNFIIRDMWCSAIKWDKYARISNRWQKVQTAACKLCSGSTIRLMKMPQNRVQLVKKKKRQRLLTSSAQTVSILCILEEKKKQNEVITSTSRPT